MHLCCVSLSFICIPIVLLLVVSALAYAARLMFFRGPVCVLIIMSLFDDIHCRYTRCSFGCVKFSFSVVRVGKGRKRLQTILVVCIRMTT